MINTFLIGAQKAGTTSLFSWLGQHPKIDAPIETKDLHFFSYDKNFCKGYNYLDKFYNKEKKVRLHAAVNYLYFSNISAKRISEYIENPKFIVCIRNPVDRAVSAYNYNKMTQREHLSFEKAIEREFTKSMNYHQELADYTYLEHGKYFSQIVEYLKFFPLKSFNFVIFEELMNPKTREQVMKKIFAFIDVDPNIGINYSHLNESGEPRISAINRVIYSYKLRNLLKKYLLLDKAIPNKLRAKVIQRITETNISSKSKKQKYSINKKLRLSLELWFWSDVEQLQNLIGKDLLKTWNFSSANMIEKIL